VIECQSCGHLNEDGVQFCDRCHAFLEWQGARRTERPQSSVTAELDRTPLVVAPGEKAGCRVRVRNSGTIVDEFRLEVVGDAAAWSAIEPPVVRLFPNTSQAATITFSPPRSPAVGAGPTRYGVKVSSTVRPDVYTVENDLIDVGPYVDWSAELVPPRSRADVEAGHKARVHNRGNAPVQVVVSVRPADDELAFEGVPASLTVAPGQVADAALTVRPRRPAPPEQERSHPFQVVVESLEGRHVTLDGTMVQQGRPIRVEWYARLVPPSSRAAGSVDHRVQVINRGEAPLTVGIQAQDPSGALLLELSGQTLTVAPGDEAEAILRATPVERMSRGPERPRPFQVVVRGPASAQTVMDGLLVQVPPGRERQQGGGGGRRWAALLGVILAALVLGSVFLAARSCGGPTGPPTQISVLDEIGTSRCETFETVDVVIDGRDRGTLTVDNTGRTDATLQATVNGSGAHDYKLVATGKFDVQGHAFELQGGGSGTINVSGAANSFSVEVDDAVLAAGHCPAQGGNWPLLLRAH
jgi:hypothetical protein